MNMIWFDLDNSPHVPIFRLILQELQKKDQKFIITARDFAQTIGLLNFWGIDHIAVGRHGGKNKLNKVINLFHRSKQLRDIVKSKNITLAVSHGSRTQVLTSFSMGIDSIVMLDYEYTESRIFNTCATYLLIPSLIPDQRLREAGFNMKKVIRYHGFKEELYLNDFIPNPGFRKTLGISDESILVTLRPPSTVGNYHDNRSETYFKECIKYFSNKKNVICLIINRLTDDKNLLLSQSENKSNIKFLDKAVDGLQLIWNSDIVVSGGGTMNRESALLNVPTYSIFTGRRPYLDEYLQERKKLTFINKIEDIENIPVKKRNISVNEISFGNKVVDEVAGLIMEKTTP
jgi:uncharacterized protein